MRRFKSYGEFSDSYFGAVENPLANPDVLAAPQHEASLEEECIRHLLDHPYERLELLGENGEIVFALVFLEGLSYRAAGRKMGKSAPWVQALVEECRNKIDRYFRREHLKDGF